jgi:hypothetical protein
VIDWPDNSNPREETMVQTTKVLTTLATLLMLTTFAQLACAQPTPTTIAFPMIGVGFNQFLQLNVITFPPNPCAITVGVLGPEGEVIVAFEEGSPDKPVILGNQVSFVPQRNESSFVVLDREVRREKFICLVLTAAPKKNFETVLSATKIISFISLHICAPMETLFCFIVSFCKDCGRLCPTDNVRGKRTCAAFD